MHKNSKQEEKVSMTILFLQNDAWWEGQGQKCDALWEGKGSNMCP